MRHHLTSLRASTPIGAMGAMGLVRICSSVFDSRLHWEDTHAVLSVKATKEDLIQALIDHAANAKDCHELTWSDQIKGHSKAEFVSAMATALAEASPTERRSADWFSAFGSELATSPNGEVRSTPFDMTFAAQRLLRLMKTLAKSLSSDGAAGSFREALFGPWRYQDKQHSMGWDPSAVQVGAKTYKAPTDITATSTRAAVWLAFNSLPLFPCFARATRGFERHSDGVVFTWPVWSVPITLREMQSLLRSEEHPAELRRRGVEVVYRSERRPLTKYAFSFMSAEPASG